MPRKKTVQKRTPGFTTTDKEIHDLLDTVRPVAERLYRKLQQRVNVKRGDNLVFPTWDQLIKDTGIAHRNTIGRAIKELEAAGLIAVARSYNKDLQRKNVNQYYIVPTSQLSQYQNLQEPVSNLKNPSIKTDTVTRMKGTRMNITNMKKGNLKPKKGNKGLPPSPPAPGKLSPGANKKEGGQYQNGTGSGRKPVPDEELRKADEKWKERQALLESLS